MNKQFLKKIIIFCVILVLIAIITIITLKFYLNIDNNTSVETLPPGEDFLDSYGKSLRGGIDYRSYFDIKLYMQKYLKALNIKDSQYGYYDKNGDYIATSDQNEIKQKIYNLLSNKYINENGITIDNLENYIKVFQRPTLFVPIEISLIQDGDIKSFLVYGLIESSENYTVINKIFAVVNINISEGRYSIEPIDGEYNSINEINIDKLEDSIISNEDNHFMRSYIEAEDIPTEYINLYKGLALGAPEKLYDLLDEEYRNIRFGDIEQFKNYIQENKEEIVMMQLDKYQIKVEDNNNVRYVCIDKKGNYYIIKQKQALSEYAIILDSYTIDLPEFIEKYDTSAKNVKMALNIEKLIKATKSKDYKYVYNKLNDTFKSTSFKTQEQFEKYIEEKYDAENDKITYESYEENAGVHIYNIKVTNEKEDKTINAKVVMKLKENRDFELSFSAVQ